MHGLALAAIFAFLLLRFVLEGLICLVELFVYEHMVINRCLEAHVLLLDLLKLLLCLCQLAIEIVNSYLQLLKVLLVVGLGRVLGLLIVLGVIGVGHTIRICFDL